MTYVFIIAFSRYSRYVIELKEVQEFIFSQCSKLSTDEVEISKSRGLVLAGTVISNDDIPPFPNTAMDGYTVRALDTVNAPVELKVVGTLPAGKVPDFKVGPDEAVRIMTGAVIPEGADSVVMVEKTREAERDNFVVVEESVKDGNFIRQSGEDFVKGTELFASGTLIGAAHIGVFATIGLEEVTVFKRPVVGVMSTGDELVQGATRLEPGQIRDSNRVLTDYMWDWQRARKHGRVSSGNGRRQSYRHLPMVRMTNTFLEGGNEDPQEIIEDTEYGIYVAQLGGGQVNTATACSAGACPLPFCVST